jgi:hypothetical protein
MGQMTIQDYIKQVKTFGDVMGLAKQLKKLDVPNFVVNASVAQAREVLMEVNRKDYDRYVEYVGCHSGINKDYGCMDHEINCNHGGTIKISDWRAVENSGGSIATIHISNGWGMGGGEYLNDIKDIDKQIEQAKGITWIDETERTFLINALEGLKG